MTEHLTEFNGAIATRTDDELENDTFGVVRPLNAPLEQRPLNVPQRLAGPPAQPNAVL